MKKVIVYTKKTRKEAKERAYKMLDRLENLPQFPHGRADYDDLIFRRGKKLVQQYKIVFQPMPGEPFYPLAIWEVVK